MTVTLAQLRTGIAANLTANITGCQISAYVLSNPTPPCLWVRPASEPAVTYSQAMGNGSQEWYLLIQGYIPAAADVASQVLLDQWIAPAGANSVKAAVESDLSLGGVLDAVQPQIVVEECRAYEKYVLPSGSEVLGAEWAVLAVT